MALAVAGDAVGSSLTFGTDGFAFFREYQVALVGYEEHGVIQFFFTDTSEILPVNAETPSSATTLFPELATMEPVNVPTAL